MVNGKNSLLNKVANRRSTLFRKRRIIPNTLNSRLSRQLQPFSFLLLVHFSLPRNTRLFRAPILDRNKHAASGYSKFCENYQSVLARRDPVEQNYALDAQTPQDRSRNQPRQTIRAEPRETARLEEASDTAAVDEATDRTTRRFAVESQPRPCGIQ